MKDRMLSQHKQGTNDEKNLLSFDEFFSECYLRQYFKDKLRGRNGGGRDRQTPDAFAKRHDDEFKEAARRCREGRYKFSVYNERIVNKGRKQFPRIISVPSVRDRLILGVLNRYLQQQLPGLVNRKSANELIRSVQNIDVKTSNKRICYIKADFRSFYDSIDRKILVKKVANKNIDSRALKLISEAIEIPTSSAESKEIPETEEYGIPQGLAISNILSDIYLEEFDAFIQLHCYHLQ